MAWRLHGLEKVDKALIIRCFRVALCGIQHGTWIGTELFGQKFKKLQLLDLVQQLELVQGCRGRLSVFKWFETDGLIS